MLIKDGDWTLIDYDHFTKRQVWATQDSNGHTVVRTDYHVDETLAANKDRRDMAGASWKGDWHHVASIPPNVYHAELGDAAKQKDDKFMRKWLNDSDNRAWRTKEGRS